jgi:glycosyltransferase involved in cell wall biosynthesis
MNNRPVIIRGHIHGDIYPRILDKMPQTADNGGQTRWDYYDTLEACKAGYDAIVVNYGKFKGPGVRESWMTPDERILTPYEAANFDGPKITFLHVAAEGYGQDIAEGEAEDLYLKFFQPLGDLQKALAEVRGQEILSESEIATAEVVLEQKREEATKSYLEENTKNKTGVAKEHLWPYIPSIASQVAGYIDSNGVRSTLQEGKSLMSGGYADYGFFSVLLREHLKIDEVDFPSIYVTHSVSLGDAAQQGKESTVLEPILNPQLSNLTVSNGNIPKNPAFIEKSVLECAFPFRRLIEESMPFLQTVVMATSPLHFAAYPFLQDERRQGFAVPGIDHAKSKPWHKHLEDDPALAQYKDASLSAASAAESYLAAQGLPTDRKIIYAAARLQSIKGFQHVIRAVAEAGKTRDDLCLLVTAGPQEGKRDAKEQAYWDSLLKLADQLGVQLVLRPGTGDIYRYMAAIGEQGGIFMNLAEFEPFGMAPMEAIANNLPLIVDKRAGCVTSEYMIDCVHACVGDYANPQLTGALIVQVLGDQQLYQSLQKNGRDLAIATTWENTFVSSLARLEEGKAKLRSGELSPVREMYTHEWDKILGLAGIVNRQTRAAIDKWQPDDIAVCSSYQAYSGRA